MLIGVFAYFYPSLSTRALGDPDRFYHFAVSKMFAETGIVRAIPAIEDIGWSEEFYDKEFFFHVLTGLGYHWGGDAGVAGVTAVVGCLCLLALFIAARRYMGDAAALAAVLLIAVGCSRYFSRLYMLRPHVLAILIFTWALSASMRRAPAATAAAMFLFALSYHGVYAPLAVLGGVAIAGLATRSAWQKTFFSGAAGLVAGTVLNPYFPANVVIVGMIARIGLRTGSVTDTGAELAPFLSSTFVKGFAIYLVLFVAAVMAYVDLRRARPLLKEGESARQDRFAFVVALSTFGVFLTLAAVTPRSFEYAVPAAVLTAATFYNSYGRPRRYLLWAAALAMGLQAHLFVEMMGVSKKPSAIDRLGMVERALAYIPEVGRKVFNCEWDVSPYMLYLRPDLRFVDILDPTFLYDVNPGLYERRASVKSGSFADPYVLLRNIFKADFAICSTPGGVDVLEHDPNFQRVFPVTLQDLPDFGAGVYQLRASRAPQSVLRYRFVHVGRMERNSVMTWRPSAPSLPDTAQNWPPEKFKMFEVPFGFMDLDRDVDLTAPETKPEPASEAHAGFTAQADAYVCADVEVEATEMARLAGADWVGVGGGPHVRLWLNGTPIFATGMPISAPRLISWTVPLTKPLQPTDHLRTLVCRPEDGAFFGLSLTLWKREELGEACASRRYQEFRLASPAQAWPRSTDDAFGCFGPVAPILAEGMAESAHK